MTVDANADGTMDVTKLDEVLNQAKAEGLIPFAIVGTAVQRTTVLLMT